MHALQAAETRCPPPPAARGSLARVKDSARRLMREDGLLAPVWAFRIHPVREIRGIFLDLGDGGICAPALVELPGTIAAVAAAACTLGPGVEARVTGMFAPRERSVGPHESGVGPHERGVGSHERGVGPSERGTGANSRVLAMALDELASERLFRLSDQLHGRIARAAKSRGWRASAPESPGDPGIALDQQSAVLALSGIDTQAIVANASGMLWPVKSLSFVVVLGTDLPDRPAASRCISCASRERCSLRR